MSTDDLVERLARHLARLEAPKIPLTQFQCFADSYRQKAERILAEVGVPTLLAEVDRLRAELADEKAAHAKTCDNFEVFADSSIAERARLRQELADAHRDLTRARQAFTELLNTGAAASTGDGTQADG